MTVRLEKSDPDFAIFGFGGHAKEVAWIIRRAIGASSACLFVVDEMYLTEANEEHTVLDANSFLTHYRHVPIVIAVGNCTARISIARRLSLAGARFGSFADPTAVVGSNVELAAGTIIGPNCVVTVDVTIGAHTHLNSGCVVSHDTKIGTGCQLSPGVQLGGHVNICDGVFLGIGSIVANGTQARPLRIGTGAVVGASACVLTDVEDGSVVAGIPARPLTGSRT